VPGGTLGQKGGGQTQVAPGPQAAPAANTPAGNNPNVYQQSANAYTGALQGTQNAMGYQPQQVGTQFGYTPDSVGTQFGYSPDSVAAKTAAGGINTYMNPYTNQVINASMADLERQRQTQMGSLGAQATAAGAFGGSRQGVAEALTNEGFAQQGGQLAGQLRQQGFNTALGASQQDVSNQMQAALANQAARAQAAQFGQSTGLQAQGMNQQARAQATQFGQQNRLQAQMANQQAGLQGAQQRLGAAGQLGNLSQMGFGFGQQIGQQQTQQGQMQQMMNQALIDAAKGQYGGFTGAPQQSLGLPMAALGGANMGQQTQTQTRNPGLFDFLTAGASLFCWVAREVYGEEDPRWVQFRTWLLNDAPKWLLNLYAKHGEWFAGVVRKAPILKRALRPLMDRARRAAGFVE
jgi:hypothetical protein